MSREEFRNKLYPLMGLDCIQKYHMDGLRDYDQRIWYKIIAGASSYSDSCEQAVDSSQSSGTLRAEIENALAGRKLVESRLDYMLRYCELGQQTQSSSAKSLEPSILTKFRDSQQWLKQPLQSHELNEKVEELDIFMVNLLQQPQ